MTRASVATAPVTVDPNEEDLLAVSRSAQSPEPEQPSSEWIGEDPVLPRRSAWCSPYAVLAVFVFALGARLFAIRTAYNIFIDEVTYSTIAHNLGSGAGLTLYGRPFTLHPPVALTLLAAQDKIFGFSSEPLDQQVLLMRILPAIFGAGAVTLGYLITVRTARRAFAPLAVAALMVLNPFQVYFDSRVLLEPFAQFFVTGSVFLLVLSTGTARGSRRRRLAVVGAAASAGLAFATKETFGLVWAVALLALLLTPHLIPRRTTFRVLLGGAGVYAAITAIVWAVYGPSAWWSSHSSGFNRLVGTEQSTGFNAASTKVTLLERVQANLVVYCVTYVLLAAGSVAAVVLLVRTRAWVRRPRSSAETRSIVVAVWAVAAAAYLAYATLFGSIEEQMYYIPLLPCTMSLALLWDRRQQRANSGATKLVAAITTAAVVFSGVVWVEQRRTDHNRYAEFLSWARVNVQDGSTVAVADETAQFLLEKVVIGQWVTPAEWQAHNVDYVLVDSSLVEQGYSRMDLSTLTALEQDAPAVFSATSDDSTLYLFEVPSESP